MSITLSGAEIRQLAEFAGFVIHEYEHGYDDELETDITVMDCPGEGVLDDDGTARHYGYIAYISEYPEEGCLPLGDELIDA